MSRDNPTALEERIRSDSENGLFVRVLDDVEDRGLRLMQSPETYEEGRTLVANATAGYEGLRLAEVLNARWWAIEQRDSALAWEFLNRSWEVHQAGDVASANAMFERWLDWQEGRADLDAQNGYVVVAG